MQISLLMLMMLLMLVMMTVMITVMMMMMMLMTIIDMIDRSRCLISIGDYDIYNADDDDFDNDTI